MQTIPNAKFYENLPVLILGASGFIGRWIARYLSGTRCSLFLVVRDSRRSRKIFNEYTVNGELIEIDLTNFSDVTSTIKNIKPSIIFNLAGYGVDPSERDPEQARLMNADLVRVLCENLRVFSEPKLENLQLIHIGSALEYGTIGGNLSEDSIPHPTTLYGQTKLTGTETVKTYGQKYGVRGITARLFTVYGPGEHPQRLLPTLIEAARNQHPIPLTEGFQKRDFTYVEDVAEGLIRLSVCNAPPGQIVNLATGKLTTVREFVKIAADVLNIQDNFLQFGALPTRKEEMNHDDVSIDQLKQFTGWTPPTSIREGIQRTIAFFNKRGSLHQKNFL
ncbi:MAG: NAD(P)-dependent oxidoreductase [Calditrichaeota bacterium]|nr:MAG: NAD(P)-dependent oxidoreductase [Calditrichota bacterium]